MNRKFKQKASYVYTLLAVLISVQASVDAYAQKKMANAPFKIHLEQGENPSVEFGTLSIEPVNLFVQPKPWNDDSPNIQLELNIDNGEEPYSTFLWFYDAVDPQQRINYPLAFGCYTFSLDINGDEVDLVVDELDFEEVFTLNIHQKATIGDLSILFESCIGEWIVDYNHRQTDAYNTFYIVLSDNEEQETFYFKSLNKYEGNEFLIEWKDYKILVSHDSEKFIKLKASKKD